MTAPEVALSDFRTPGRLGVCLFVRMAVEGASWAAAWKRGRVVFAINQQPGTEPEYGEEPLEREHMTRPAQLNCNGGYYA